MRPTISVIIPAYNVSNFIEDTIKSVKRQDYSLWECIIINDGSNDSTRTVVSSCIKNDDRFTLINQENKGVSIARNVGIDTAKGDYILCLDGDDLISSNFLTEMLSVIETDTDIKVVTPRVKFVGKATGEWKFKPFVFQNLLAANQMVVTSLFRKVDFQKFYKFNSNMKSGLEDWDFWIGLLKHGGKVVHAPEAVFYYRIQKKSRNSSLNSEKQSKLRYQMWLNHKEQFSKYFIDPKTTEEYLSISQSLEYRIGKILIKPLRYIKNLFR
ncbi:glycosyltransferase family A protein [Sphingobacterium sp.]|uniref:glycosyltransferase family 2 protein n=1 Tax=Sphingobacterium sp. TaxID=341027 RepID=UPI002896C832|nr:glycosyltransferase family A protein [Sphingobacterium sp.]